MITLKYSKTGNAVFVSHMDTLRNIVRIMRRAKLEVNFSKGYNPHMLLFFSPPLALGVNSVAEYVTADIDNITAEEFLNAFNGVTSDGIYGLEAFYTEKSPNLAGRIIKADYFFPLKNSDYTAKLVEFFKNCNHYEIKYKQKDRQITKEVSSQIFSVTPCDKGIIFGLATGNDNLRADRFTDAINADFNMDINILDIQKIAQFININDNFIDAQKFLSAGGNLEKTVY